MVDPSDLLIATCEAPDAADPWIVVTVGLEHLLSLGGGYVQPACARVDLRTCFHSPGGLSARSRPAPACRQMRNRHRRLAPIGVSGRSESPTLPRKEERVLLDSG